MSKRDDVASESAVTLLFTDIEDSTGLWERRGKDMALALAAHDALARQAIERRAGTIVKTTGDGLLAVFPDPGDAIAAVLEIQQQLADSDVTHGILLRVRCGLHTGVVEWRGGDLFGSHVSRASRVMDLAHGGQVLLSQALEQQVRGSLSPEIALRDMGPVRLRGIAIAERVFQLVHPGIRADFPALRSLERAPHNLPGQLTSFIGREEELQAIDSMLTAHRLVTLLGMGGLGKSRLSLQAAANALDRFLDGVWFVDLAPIHDPSLVGPTIAQTMSVREEAGRPILDTLSMHLGSRTVLVILDNCEHLMAACAKAAQTLLERAPGLRVLATSREALAIAGEQIYPVNPLSVPKKRGMAGDVMKSSAVQLFLDRMRLHTPAFAPTAGDASIIAEICARLEGIPLALELAAARANALTLAEINGRLRDRLKFLARVSRHTGEERQRTVRALVAWSYDLLQPDEQILFERLCIFAGGFDLEALESVCAITPLERDSIDQVLTALVEKSLLSCDREHVSARYYMLETLRDFARERLSARGEIEAMEDRHCNHFFRFAKEGNAGLKGGQQGDWIRRVELELDNVRAAMMLPLSPRGDPVLAVKFHVAMLGFWILRGYVSEGRKLVREALALEAVTAMPLARAHALYAGAVLAQTQGDYAEAGAMLERCLELRRGLGDPVQTAAALSSLGFVRMYEGAPDEAQALEREALTLFREIGDRLGEAIVLAQLGQVACELHQDREAGELFAQSGLIAQALQNREMEAEAERLLGELALRHGGHDEALQRFQRSLKICEECGNRRDEAVSRSLIARTRIATGEVATAREELDIALGTFRDLEMNAEMIQSVEDAAMLACALKRESVAAMLLAAAETARDRLGVKRGVRSAEHWEKALAETRQALADLFSAAWSEGRALDLRGAAQLALTQVLAESA